MSETTERFTTVLYTAVIIAGILIGVLIAPNVWSVASDAGGADRPSVAVITLQGGTTDENVDAIKRDLREARADDSIEAVVIQIDSPGGPVDASEELYLAVNRTAQQMPVAAYVEGAAASGGYYGIVSADRIFVKPSSTVGSVGVIVQAPLSAVDQQEQVLKTFIRSGPDKAVITRDGIRQELQTLQNAFVGSVMNHRGGELTLSREEVSAADTYLGTEAVQNGFADEIGDLHSAIEYAAAQAGDLDRTRIDGDSYDVVYENPPLSDSAVVIESGSVENVEGNIVYVDQTNSEQEFVRPVRYYAVWGVPSNAIATDREVGTNATS